MLLRGCMNRAMKWFVWLVYGTHMLYRPWTIKVIYQVSQAKESLDCSWLDGKQPYRMFQQFLVTIFGDDRTRWSSETSIDYFFASEVVTFRSGIQRMQVCMITMPPPSSMPPCSFPLQLRLLTKIGPFKIMTLADTACMLRISQSLLLIMLLGNFFGQ